MTLDELPKIRIDFFFSGDDFHVDDITERLGILPTKIWKEKDFNIKEFAKTIWMLKTEKDSCKAVSLQFEKVLEKLRGKKEIINQICKENDIKAGFEVKVFMENGDGPELVLTREIISFLASINAEIGFDLYID